MRKARGGSQSGGTRRGRGRRGSRLTVRQRFLQQQQAEKHPEPHGGSGRDAGLRRDRSGDGGGRRPRGASAGGGGGEESAGAPCPGLRAWEAAQGPLLPPLALPRWGGGDRCAHRRALWRQLAAGRPCLSRHLLPRFTARMVKASAPGLQPQPLPLRSGLCLPLRSFSVEDGDRVALAIAGPAHSPEIYVQTRNRTNCIPSNPDLRNTCGSLLLELACQRQLSFALSRFVQVQALGCLW